MIYNSWDTELNILKLIRLGHFLPFYFFALSSFYTCVSKITIIRCTVPEIRSKVDRIFCHSGLLFALLPPYGPGILKFWKNETNSWRYHNFTNVYHKWQSYDVWFLRYWVQQTEFFVILDHFCPFTPLTIRKIKILKKWKKLLDIILHMLNDSHIMYGSWDMECNRQNAWRY